jgi:hypothetical protein
MPTPSSLVTLLAALALFSPSINRADSVELVVPDALDVARELGLNIVKFSTKFKEPVYLTVQLTMMPLGAAEATVMEHVYEVPATEHVFSLTMRDLDQTARLSGGTPDEKSRNAIGYSFFHPQGGFSHRELSPFGPPQMGQAFTTFVERQTMEAIQLGEAMPLLIKAGPFDEKTPAPKNLRQNYINAPAYIALTAKFTKEKPVAEPEAPAPAPESKEKAPGKEASPEAGAKSVAPAKTGKTEATKP